MANRIEEECLRMVLNYQYMVIVEKKPPSFFKEDDIIANNKKLLNGLVGQKSQKSIELFNKVLEVGKQHNVIIKYPALMCNFHLRKLRKRFNIVLQDDNEYYYYVCDLVIMEYEKKKKILPLRTLSKHTDLIPMFKQKQMIYCCECNNPVDEEIKENVYKNTSPFSFCNECKDVVCGKCILDGKHQ